MEVACLVWVVEKLRHMLERTMQPTILCSRQYWESLLSVCRGLWFNQFEVRGLEIFLGGGVWIGEERGLDYMSLNSTQT